MRALALLAFMSFNAHAGNITNDVSLLNISTETAVFSTTIKPLIMQCLNAAGTALESCAGSGGHSDGTNAESGFLCLGVDAAGNCQLAVIDASAVNSSTNPVQSNFLFDHDADASAHHAQTTANDDAADAAFLLFQGTHSATPSAHHAQTTANDDAADTAFLLFQGTHSASASAHHSKTVSSEIDHDSITGVSTADHHSQTTANDDAADAAFALFQGTHSANASAHHAKTVSSDIDHDSITGVSTSDHHTQTVDTNTNAATICSATEYLEGNGTCDVLATGAHTTANDDAADSTFSTFLGTHSASATAHHTKTVSSEIDHDSITGVSTSDHHAQTVDTNTNASTICSATEYLEGDGTCDVLATGAHTTANNDAADTAFMLFQGTHSADVSAHHTATVDTNASTICTGTDVLNGSGACVGAGGGHGDGSNATSGNVCLGVDASGNCQEAVVDALSVNGSTNPVQSDALFDHDADASAHHTKTTDASELVTGTLPDGRFPATLPTASGENLTGFVVSASSLTEPNQDINTLTYVGLGTTTITLRGGRPVLIIISVLINNDTTGTRQYDAAITIDGVIVGSIDNILVPKNNAEVTFDRHSYIPSLSAGVHEFSVIVRSNSANNTQVARSFRLTVLEF